MGEAKRRRESNPNYGKHRLNVLKYNGNYFTVDLVMHQVAKIIIDEKLSSSSFFKAFDGYEEGCYTLYIDNKSTPPTIDVIPAETVEEFVKMSGISTDLLI